MDLCKDRGRRLFGHPLHPALVHFPVALLSISLLWDITGMMVNGPFWPRMSLWCIIAGLVTALPAAATGMSDYVLIGNKHPGLHTATTHMIVMFGALSFYTASLFFRLRITVSSRHAMLVPILLSLPGFVLILIGGWLGGELVLRYGIGTTAGRDDEE